MGLDVYVGPLCRYYAGDWKLITQQAAEAEGVEFQIVRTGPQPPEDAISDSHAARGAILEWRTALQDAAHDDLPALEWDESPEADYFTDKPDWDGYFATRLLAGTVEFPEVPPPARVGRSPEKSALYRRIEEVYFGRPQGLLARLRGRPKQCDQVPRYPHLQVPELWLPVAFAEPFGATDPAGAQMMFGSLPRLVRELQSVNERTVRLDGTGIEDAMRQGPPEPGGPLDATARFGLAIFLKAARHGVEHRHPMKLDY